MKLRLDTKTVANLLPDKARKETFAWDTDVEGFGCRVWHGADKLRRTYVVQYRAGGHTRRITIGSAATLTPSQARETARKLLGRVANGHDPQAEKDAGRRRAALTMRSVVTTYLEDKRTKLRLSTFANYERYLTGPYFRSLHPMSVTAITRADVSACIRAITREHTASTAVLCRQMLSAFFAWTIADGLLGNDANPVAGSHDPERSPSRDHVLADGELAAIWKACGDDHHGRVIRLLILLGSRRAEVGGMRWSELDLAAGTWTLPAERSKNKRAHTLPLPPAALAIINSIPQTDREQLFGKRASSGFTDWSQDKLSLDRRLTSAIVRPWRVHDLRRTVATGMADIGIEPHVIEAVLNHYSGHRSGVAGTYNRSNYERAVKAALIRWSEHVLALVEGRADNKVIPLHA